jgi:hypothetical protein
MAPGESTSNIHPRPPIRRPYERLARTSLIPNKMGTWAM